MYGFNIGIDRTYAQVIGALYKGASVYASRAHRHIDIIPTEDFSDSFIRSGENDYELDKTLRDADDYLARMDADDSENQDKIEVEAEDTSLKNAEPPTENNYDFASLYGLSVSSPERPKFTYDENDADIPVEASVEHDYSTPQDGLYNEYGAEGLPVELTGIEHDLDTPQDGQFYPQNAEGISIENTGLHPKKSDLYNSDVYGTSKPAVPDVSTELAQPITKTNVIKIPVSIEQTSQAPDISGMTLLGQAKAIAKWQNKTIMSEEVLIGAFGKAVIMKLVGEGYLVRTRKGILLGS